jgi:heme exporter protein CcmD
MREFFAMSGYATYVWSSYAVGIGALLLNVFWSRALLRRAEAEARRRMAIEEYTA